MFVQLLLSKQRTESASTVSVTISNDEALSLPFVCFLPHYHHFNWLLCKHSYTAVCT